MVTWSANFQFLMHSFVSDLKGLGSESRASLFLYQVVDHAVTAPLNRYHLQTPKAAGRSAWSTAQRSASHLQWSLERYCMKHCKEEKCFKITFAMRQTKQKNNNKKQQTKKQTSLGFVNHYHFNLYYLFGWLSAGMWDTQLNWCR